jgi:hypothetical protein
LSAIETVALRAPEAVGVKVIVKVQLAEGATLDPHVFVWEKSPGLVPVNAILVILSVAVPTLLSVTVWAALVVFTSCEAKTSEVVESLVTAEVPVPVKPTICGLPAALS